VTLDERYCEECGFALSPSAKFCAECGSTAGDRPRSVGAADMALPTSSPNQRRDRKFKEWEEAWDKLDYFDPSEPEYDQQLERIDHLDAELDALMEAMEIEEDLDDAAYEHQSVDLASPSDDLDPEQRAAYRRRLEALADDAELKKRELEEQISQMRKRVPYGTVAGPVPEGASRSSFVCARCSAALFEDSDRYVVGQGHPVHPCGNCGYENETEVKARLEDEQRAKHMPDLHAVAAWIVVATSDMAVDGDYAELRLLEDGTLWQGPETGDRLRTNFALRCSEPTRYQRFIDRKFKSPHLVERFLKDHHEDLGASRLVPPTAPVASWTYSYSTEWKRKTAVHEQRICLYPDGGLFRISPTNSATCINEGQNPVTSPVEAEQYVLDSIERGAPGFGTNPFIDLVRDSETLDPAKLPDWTPDQATPSSSAISGGSGTPGKLNTQSEERKFALREQGANNEGSGGKLDDNVAFVLQIVLALAIVVFYFAAPITAIVPAGALLYLIIHQGK